jgi:hypothetical protein
MKLAQEVEEPARDIGDDRVAMVGRHDHCVDPTPVCRAANARQWREIGWVASDERNRDER